MTETAHSFHLLPSVIVRPRAQSLSSQMTESSFDRTNDNMPPPPYEMHRRKNIILFGETGAGKSAVINLLAGKELARTSPDTRACTLQASKYTLTLSGERPNDAMSLNIWDTIGLEEPDKEPLQAIENAHALITDLHAAGGVDLLLFCFRAGRITVAMQRHHRLFFEFLCDKRVPLAIVVTHLENEKVMEDWWVRNAATLIGYGMCSVAHACITAMPAHLAVHVSRRTESQTTLRGMLRKTLSGIHPVYVPEDVWQWFIRLAGMMVEFFTWGILKKRALVKRLGTRCAFRQEDAERIAEMLLASAKRK